MPTEIQYGVEVGGREWALSRGGKHSNNTMKRRRRWRRKERGGGCPDLRQERASNGFPAPSLLSIPHLSSKCLSLWFHSFRPLFLSVSFFPYWCFAHWGSHWDWDVQPAWPYCWDEAGVRTRVTVCVCVCVGRVLGFKETTLCPHVIISHFL